MNKFEEFKTFIKKICIDENIKSMICTITDDKIKKIIFFLEKIIPKCPNIDISYKDINNGRIIGYGGTGITYLANNKIIKICVCTDKYPLVIVENEVKLHTEIEKCNNPNFIKLFGYYINNGNKYIYYDKSNNFTKPLCIVEDIENFNNTCELYVILEAGERSLYSHIRNKLINENFNIVSLLKILSFYKINEKFVLNNEILLHNDIKSENIVLMNNGLLKLIDFGHGEKTNKFFNFGIGGTLRMYDLLYNYEKDVDIENNKTYLYFKSPFFDIFCVCIIICEYLCKFYITRDINNDFDYIIKLIKLHVKHYYDDNVYILINNITNLMSLIYYFHKNLIKEYFIKIKSIENFTQDDVNTFWIKYIVEKTVMKNLICPCIRKYDPPKWENNNNTLINDYEYFDKIIKYIIPQLDF
jgi:hypothetical protein